MDVREKLVELLRVSPHLDVIKGYKGNDCTFEQGADWLITHGVTVQEWISVKDRLPENICPVLVVLEGISTAFDGWYHDGKWWTVGAGTRPFTQKVTHWMPRPSPPKEEEK